MPENTTLPIVLAIAGSIALLIGLFGGGVKAKEIEVPKISIRTRIFSSLVGIVLIGIAIRLPNPPAAESPTPTPIPTAEPVSVQPQITPPSPRPIDTPTDTPTNTPTNTPTYTPSPTAEPVMEIIPFGSPSDPSLLNTAFGWQAGNSTINTYQLGSSPNTLTLIANGRTHQWAELDSQPFISYLIEGDFETQVKMVFNPMWGHELAALGVRSTQDRYSWFRLGNVYAVFAEGGAPETHVVLDSDNQGRSRHMGDSFYPDSTIHLKIGRNGQLFTFSYSPNGINWITLQENVVAEMPANVEIFLTVGSWGDGGTSAQFYDFQVLSK